MSRALSMVTPACVVIVVPASAAIAVPSIATARSPVSVSTAEVNMRLFIFFLLTALFAVLMVITHVL